VGHNSKKLNVVIHDGREEPVDLKRMMEFEHHSIIGRFFKGREFDASILFEQLGPWAIDFMNVHGWAKEIPDIDSRSARLFTVWIEDAEAKEVIGMVHGFYLLLPFTLSSTTIREYYLLQEDVSYYPLAIIYSIRTIIQDENQLDLLLDRIREGIASTWKKVRLNVIDHLPKGSDLWKRYVFSFNDIIHFTFLCPSIDREVIDALQRNDYRISGVLQLLASPTPSYDEATIAHHLRTARKIVNEVDIIQNQK